LAGAGAVCLQAQPDRGTPIASPLPSAAPIITWSEKTLDNILSPGESASRSLTFTSSEPLKDIRIEVVPEIASFVTITPSTFAQVPANQPQTVRFDITVPATARFGDYEGTIQVRSGRRAVPETLRVSVRVWRHYAHPTDGFSLLFPPTLSMHEGPGGRVFFGLATNESDGDAPAPIRIFLSPLAYQEEVLRVRSNIVAALVEEPFLLSGHAAVRIDGVLHENAFGWGGQRHSYLLVEIHGLTLEIDFDSTDPFIAEAAASMIATLKIR
jgi:hypothetical protein